jgi:hypothetical protein
MSWTRKEGMGFWKLALAALPIWAFASFVLFTVLYYAIYLAGSSIFKMDLPYTYTAIFLYIIIMIALKVSEK